MWVHTQSGKAAAKTFDLLLIWFLGIQSEGKSNAVIALYKNIYIYMYVQLILPKQKCAFMYISTKD